MRDIQQKRQEIRGKRRLEINGKSRQGIHEKVSLQNGPRELAQTSLNIHRLNKSFKYLVYLIDI